MYGGGEVACFESNTHLGGGPSQHERFKLNQSRLKLHLMTLGEVVVNVLCNYYKRGGSQFSPKQVLQLESGRGDGEPRGAWYVGGIF